MRRGVVALFWLAMSIASVTVYQVEKGRHSEVLSAVVETNFSERNPVAAEAARLARDPDHAAASFARAVVVESLTSSDTAASELANRLVLLRSFVAYLPPDRFPGGDYGAELLANQELLARGPDERSSLPVTQLQRARELAKKLALDGLAVRPQFADHHFTLQMLEASGSKNSS